MLDGADTETAVAALAELLVARGQVDAKTLDRARRVAVETGQRLDTVLIQLGQVGERGLAEAYAALLGVRLAAPDRFPEEPLFPDLIKPKFLRKAHAVPLLVEHDRLIVAMVDPLDSFTKSAIAAKTGLRVAVEVAVPIELEAALDRLYPESGARKDDIVDDLSGGGEPLEEDAERLKDLASEAPVIRLVNQIIARAVETQASDIHIEPFENQLRVRYRYDGVLHEAESPPVRLTAAIISRIKIMSRLDIAERRLPQDGRLKLAVRGQEIDFRVSTVPSLHGETVVLRVLDRTAVEFEYGKLGLPLAVTKRLQTSLDLPNGIVLVTGPTGSGKTTTLYTGLLNLNSIERSRAAKVRPICGFTWIWVMPFSWYSIGSSTVKILRSIELRLSRPV